MVDIQLSKVAVAVALRNNTGRAICFIEQLREWFGRDALVDFEQRPDICSEHLCRTFGCQLPVIATLAVGSRHRRTAQDDLVLMSVAGKIARGGLHQVRGMLSGPGADCAISSIHAARSANTLKGSDICFAHDFAKPIEMSLLG